MYSMTNIVKEELSLANFAEQTSGCNVEILQL